MNDILVDGAVLEEAEGNKVVIKAWVKENDCWGYRELTPEEAKKVMELINEGV